MELLHFDRMIEHCKAQQAKQGIQDAFVSFKVPRKPQRSRVRLFGSRGPYGDILSVSDTGVVAKFKANDVIEFLERERARELQRQLEVAKRAK